MNACTSTTIITIQGGDKKNEKIKRPAVILNNYFKKTEKRYHGMQRYYECEEILVKVKKGSGDKKWGVRDKIMKMRPN